MPELLGPTRPVPGHDISSVKVTSPPPGDASVRNIVDPARVVRPDGRTEQDTGNATESFPMRYESSFMTFLQRLKNTPELSEAFFRLLQGRGLQVSSGISEGMAAELRQFLQFLPLNEGQLLAFLQQQIKSGTRFGGALFEALRAAYAGAQSDLLRTDILQFLRRYSDYSSTGHLEEKMLRTLYEMRRSLPSQWAEKLLSLCAKLENGMAAGDRAGNLALLREQLFPLMARYVGLTHDHGRARGLLSMLTLDVVRYENGGEEGLVQSFRHLCAGGLLPGDFSSLPDSEILRLLRSTEYFKAAGNTPFADHLAALSRQALSGEGGASAQEIFRNILSSILVNESVYMPLNHILIPLEWNGRPMFSEMWVDPDAEGERRDRPDRTDRSARVLIKLDIQGLGAFDVVLNAGEEVSLQIACPETVAPFSGEVTRAMGEILTRNGLRAGPISVSAMKRPLTLSQVFPTLFERMNGVNVKI